MRLFIKDHLSIIILYLTTFLVLPVVIDLLDGFENHYGYFVFLAVTGLIGFLLVRYLRRKKLYAHLETESLDKERILLYQPAAAIEKAYGRKSSSVYSLLLEEEEAHQAFLEEQQLLISHAVHQMKTPVYVLQLLVQSNQTKQTNSPEAWISVQKEIEKINFSLNQLLSYSRSTKLLSDFKIEPVNVRMVVYEVINDLKGYFIEEEVFPKVNIPENTQIYSDRKWIKVVLYQLLNNAIKYGEKNTTIHITYEEKQLSIQNQGETIPQQDLNRIFDLFYTGSKGRKSSEATGIGLYLVKKILTTFHHAYKITSSDQETIFSITFE